MMDTKSIAEKLISLIDSPDPEVIQDAHIKTVAQAYLTQCQEVERLKGETYEGKIELTARDCRHIREDALEEAAKEIDRLGQTHTLYSADFMAREIRALKDKQ